MVVDARHAFASITVPRAAILDLGVEQRPFLTTDDDERLTIVHVAFRLDVDLGAGGQKASTSSKVIFPSMMFIIEEPADASTDDATVETKYVEVDQLSDLNWTGEEMTGCSLNDACHVRKVLFRGIFHSCFGGSGAKASAVILPNDGARSRRC